MDEAKSLINLYVDEKKAFLDHFPVDEVEQALECIWSAYLKGKRVFIFGNGGNAAYAANMATDLLLHPFVSDNKDKGLSPDIPRLHAFNLSDSATTLTALLNDLGRDAIYTEQLIAYSLTDGDVVIAYSGSGNSVNILNAMALAKTRGAHTIGIARGDGGKLKAAADICIITPGSSTFPGQTGGNDFNFHFEDALSSIAHIITGIIKQRVQALSNG